MPFTNRGPKRGGSYWTNARHRDELYAKTPSKTGTPSIYGNLDVGGSISATGNISSTSITTTGSISSTSITTTGNLSAADITASGDITSFGNLLISGTITGSMNPVKKTIDNTFNTAATATATLTAAQSGTLFLIDGTDDNVINLPALLIGNVGVHYEFQLTKAVGGSKTTTFVLPGLGVSNFQAMISLVDGTAANPTSEVAGDTLTLLAATVANARVSMTCVVDDGTNSTWMATVLSTPIATVD